MPPSSPQKSFSYNKTPDPNNLLPGASSPNALDRPSLVSLLDTIFSNPTWFGHEMNGMLTASNISRLTQHEVSLTAAFPSTASNGMGSVHGGAIATFLDNFTSLALTVEQLVSNKRAKSRDGVGTAQKNSVMAVRDTAGGGISGSVGGGAGGAGAAAEPAQQDTSEEIVFRPSASVSLNCTYMRPIIPGVEVRIDAWVAKRGRDLAFLGAKICNLKGDVLVSCDHVKCMSAEVRIPLGDASMVEGRTRRSKL